MLVLIVHKCIINIRFIVRLKRVNILSAVGIKTDEVMLVTNAIVFILF